MRWKRSISVLASTGLLAVGLAVPAHADATVTVGVGHFDPDNQDPSTGTVVEYTDFFGRSVRVDRDDTVNFQTQKNEFHSIALALAVIPLPVFVADTDDAPARGTGLAEVAGGPGRFAGFGPPYACGAE